MRCASCNSDNPDGAKFCIECAAPLQKRCPSCGAENLPRAKFCGECATPLTSTKPGKRRAESGEQKKRTANGVERGAKNKEKGKSRIKEPSAAPRFTLHGQPKANGGS